MKSSIKLLIILVIVLLPQLSWAACSSYTDWDNFACGGTYCASHTADFPHCGPPCTIINWNNSICGGSYCSSHSQDSQCSYVSACIWSDWEPVQCDPPSHRVYCEAVNDTEHCD